MQSQSDIDRVKSNIQTMLDRGAQESEIDMYVSAEGFTPEMLRGEPARPVTTLNSESQAIINQGNKGIAAGLGAPVDIVNAGVNMVRDKAFDLEPVTTPTFGSQWWENQMNHLPGVDTNQQPQTEIGQYAGRVTRDLASTLSFTPMAAKVTSASQALSKTPILKEAAQQFNRAPMTTLGVESVASVGASTGAEIANRAAPENKYAEMLGSVAGSMTPAGISGGIRTAVRGGEGGRQVLQGNIDNYARVGGSPTVGQGTGRHLNQIVESVLTRLPGGRALSRQIDRTQDHLAQTIQRITTNGEISATRAGTTVKRGLFGAEDSFITRFNDSSERLFNKLDSHFEPNENIQVDNTVNTLQRLTTPTMGAEATSQALMNDRVKGLAQSFMSDLGNTGAMPYETIKRLRSQVGRKIGRPSLQDDIPKAELKQLYAALSQDLGQAAINKGKGAYHTFNRANQFYSAGMTRIDDQLKVINKKVNAEDVFRHVIAGSKEGATRLLAVKRSLNPEEWKVVSKTVLRRLGRAVNSQQDDLGEEFSAETFLTNWNALAGNSKDALFGSRNQFRRDIDTVAQVASNLRNVRRVGANPSGTAGAIIDATAVGGPLLALGNGNLSTAGVMAVGSATSATMSRLMQSPRFVNWLAQSTRMQPHQYAGHIARLNIIANNEPQMAAPIQDFVSNLLQPGQEAFQNQ